MSSKKNLMTIHPEKLSGKSMKSELQRLRFGCTFNWTWGCSGNGKHGQFIQGEFSLPQIPRRPCVTCVSPSWVGRYPHFEMGNSPWETPESAIEMPLSISTPLVSWEPQPREKELTGGFVTPENSFRMFSNFPYLSKLVPPSGCPTCQTGRPPQSVRSGPLGHCPFRSPRLWGSTWEVDRTKTIMVVVGCHTHKMDQNGWLGWRIKHIKGQIGELRWLQRPCCRRTRTARMANSFNWGPDGHEIK